MRMAFICRASLADALKLCIILLFFLFSLALALAHGHKKHTQRIKSNEGKKGELENSRVISGKLFFARPFRLLYT